MVYKFRIILSLIVVVGYFMMLFTIIMIESSDTFNMQAGENSFMDIVKILIGVLTTIVAKIVFFWFDPGAMATPVFTSTKFEKDETPQVPDAKADQKNKELPKPHAPLANATLAK